MTLVMLQKKPTPGPRFLTKPPGQKSRSERTAPLDPEKPLVRITIETSRRCNLACTYCYTAATPDRRDGLSDDEVRYIMRQAYDCGARAMSIVSGGESLMRRTMLDPEESPIVYANALGAYTYLYTNCTLMTQKAAEWLYRQDVTVIGKFNSLREDVQDEMVGVPGAARRIRRGVDELLKAGFANETPTRMALETVITRQNYDEMPDMWRWMRDRNIDPEVEIPTEHGRASLNHESLYFEEWEAPKKYKELFLELLRIDQTEYGYTWRPQPPFAGASCAIYQGTAYVNDQGGVQPCAGVDKEYGILEVGPRAPQGQRLWDIVTTPAFAKLRAVHDHLGGSCGSCESGQDGSCYGCRAAAYHKYGDEFAEDPTCWHPQREEPKKPLFRVFS
jgi:MoaA/NifB/PqqE/SkfB family radical SAM enzyme